MNFFLDKMLQLTIQKSQSNSLYGKHFEFLRLCLYYEYLFAEVILPLAVMFCRQSRIPPPWPPPGARTAPVWLVCPAVSGGGHPHAR